MPDPRVTHLWDEQRLASRWFAEKIDGEQGLMWDTYMLYGPQAKWEGNNAPQPLINKGGTVLRKKEELQANLAPLLQVPVP